MNRLLATVVALCSLAAPALSADELDKLKQYEYGQDQTSLLAVERQVEASMADRAKQAEMAKRLLEVMTDNGATLAAKQHAGIMLRICGTDAEAPALGKMLGEGRLGEFARGALERIPGPAAGRALRDALEGLQGPALGAVIDSVANRHDREAAGRLITLAGAADPKVAAAAVHALGRIGGPEAAACLEKRAAADSGAATAEAYLSCGTIALAAGDKQAAAAVFAALAGEKYPAPVRRGALVGQLALADEPGALLARWLDGGDPAARRVAADNLDKQPTAWLLAASKGKPLDRALVFAELLAARGQQAALPLLVQAARQKDDPALRLRGIMAMTRVGDGGCVGLLIEALGDEPAVARAAVSVLSSMGAALVENAVIEAFKESDGQKRGFLADVLVARRMTRAIPLMLDLAKIEDDSALRNDVVFVLVNLGDEKTLPAIVSLLLEVKDRQHRDRLETTYLQIAKQYDNTVEPILAAMSDEAATVALLPVLGRMGGKAAETRIEKALSSANGELRAAGIRALCNWPDASLAEKLAGLAKGEKDQAVRISALRAYIRVVSLDSDRSDAKTLQMLQWAFGVAERAEEKNLVADRVSTVRTVETLRWLVKLLDDNDVAQEACRSIVDLAHHRDLRNPNRDEFVKALRRVVEVSKDPSTVSLAKGYIEGV